MNVNDFDTLYAGYVTVHFTDTNARPMKLLATMTTWPLTAANEANEKRDYLMNYYENQRISIEKFVVEVYEIGRVQAGRIVMKRKPEKLSDY